MKRWGRAVVYALMILASLSFAGCDTGSSNKYEFQGTWAISLLGMNLASWDFGSRGGSLNAVGTPVLTFDYVTVDEAAKHILVTITSYTGGSGAPSVTNGLPAYITYSISGNDIYVHMDGSTYVAPGASEGPYTKQ